MTKLIISLISFATISLASAVNPVLSGSCYGTSEAISELYKDSNTNELRNICRNNILKINLKSTGKLNQEEIDYCLNICFKLNHATLNISNTDDIINSTLKETSLDKFPRKLGDGSTIISTKKDNLSQGIHSTYSFDLEALGLSSESEITQPLKENIKTIFFNSLKSSFKKNKDFINLLRQGITFRYTYKINNIIIADITINYSSLSQ